MNSEQKTIPALTYLKDRGSLEDCTHEAELDKALSDGPVTFYCGFDPTGKSLHSGSLVPLMAMKRLIERGHKGIALLGTATAMIGDPSGKSAERVLLDESVIVENAKCIEENIRQFFRSCNISDDQYIVVKNHEWLSPISYLDFLRDVGKLFSVNQMISRDSVKERLTKREQGISYTEFSYMLLQAYDYLHLYNKHNCRIQVGGSDQWGNITAGLDLIRKSHPDKTQAFAMTFPLLTTSDGKKFGKTESGAIYLSKDSTSVFNFHQFWLNSTDADVIKYLKLFTDTEIDKVKNLENSLKENPEAREAQNYLADQMTHLIHGQAGLDEAKSAQKTLFSGGIEGTPSLSDILSIAKTVPTKSADLNSLSDKNMQDLLVLLEAASSKSAARKLIDGGGVSLNGTKLKDSYALLTKDSFIENKGLLLKIGKKKHFVLTLND